MDNFKIYKIRCITNMHVGNGDISYNIIDNQVQRDVITNFPVVNSSSLKGSLKEFLSNELNEDSINYIFGNENTGIGNYKIFPATLLSIPVRSNGRQFFRAICPKIIEEFKNFIEDFNYNLGNDEKTKDINEDLETIINIAKENKNSISVLDNTLIEVENIKIEGFDAKVENIDLKCKNNIEKLFGENLVIIDDETFSKITNELPVIARNKLENVESKNLWYEEIVPRETRFYFGVIRGKTRESDFEKIKGKNVQIGGNATIGYGYCKITDILD